MRTALRSRTADEPYATPPAATCGGDARCLRRRASDGRCRCRGPGYAPRPAESVPARTARGLHSCPRWWRTGDRVGDQTQLRHDVVLAGSEQAEIAVPEVGRVGERRLAPHSRNRRCLRGSCRRSRSFCFRTATRLLAAIPARKDDCRSRLGGRRRSRKSPAAGPASPTCCPSSRPVSPEERVFAKAGRAVPDCADRTWRPANSESRSPPVARPRLKSAVNPTRA